MRNSQAERQPELHPTSLPYLGSSSCIEIGTKSAESVSELPWFKGRLQSSRPCVCVFVCVYERAVMSGLVRLQPSSWPGWWWWCLTSFSLSKGTVLLKTGVRWISRASRKATGTGVNGITLLLLLLLLRERSSNIREALPCTRGLHGLKTEARTRPVPEIVWPNPTRPERHG